MIEGYLYALYVDRIIEADVPYDLDGEGVEPKADSDLMVLVEPTTPRPPGPIQYETIIPPSASREGGLYRPKAVALYSDMTWVKSKTAKPVMPWKMCGIRPTFERW